MHRSRDAVIEAFSQVHHDIIDIEDNMATFRVDIGFVAVTAFWAYRGTLLNG